MARIRHVVLGEWAWQWRSRLAQTALSVLVLLIAIATVTAWQRQAATSATRDHYQREAEAAFRAQPDRHPHRVVHYGHYVFRTPAPLAAIDPGVDAFTGHSIFLEGHRRNTASFAEARETSVLTRFGNLSPAFCLQVIAPLLLILGGYATVARERRHGMLQQLLAAGLTLPQLLAGKTLALFALALLALLPLGIAALWPVLTGVEALGPALLLIGAYALYLAVWVLGIVLCSAAAGSPRAALALLLAIWTITTIMLPRVAADAAAAWVPLPTQAEVSLETLEALRELGDGHDSNDPSLASLRDRVLAQYGVERVEDLPINYRGLVALENEAATTEVANRFAAQRAQTQQQQASVMAGFAWLSPFMALRDLSMRVAGSDLSNYQRFLALAETHRFDLVQALNRLHMEKLDYATDMARSRDAVSEQQTRISSDFWQQLNEFRFAPAAPRERLQAALGGTVVLLTWLLALLATTLALLRSGRLR